MKLPVWAKRIFWIIGLIIAAGLGFAKIYILGMISYVIIRDWKKIYKNMKNMGEYFTWKLQSKKEKKKKTSGSLQ